MAKPRTPQSFKDLSDDLLTVADIAGHYALHASAFEPTSAAGRDAENGDYALPSLTRPGFDATLMAGRSLALSVDMMRGIAHLLLVDDAFFCKLSLIRPVLSSASRCVYLTESGLDTQERVRRWANLAMDSVVEQVNLLALEAPERNTLLVNLSELESLAPKLGAEVKKHNTQRRPMNLRAIGDHESDMVMVKRLIPGKSLGRSTGDVNQLMYRLTSSLIHGQDYGQALHYYRDGAQDAQHPDAVVVPYGMSLSRMTVWLLGALFAVNAATESLLAHQGRPDHKLRQTVDPVLVGWRAAYQQELL